MSKCPKCGATELVNLLEHLNGLGCKSRQIATLTARVEELEDFKADMENSFKMIMDESCSGDQVHCTCVPVLREKVKELEQANDKLARVDDRLRQDGDGSWAYSELHRDLFHILADERGVLVVAVHEVRIPDDLVKVAHAINNEIGGPVTITVTRKKEKE